MKRFWFVFSGKPLPIGVQHGCGVSARSYEDAVDLIQSKIFQGSDLPAIGRVVEDVDISTLNSNHVLPNMGNISIRGVWYPLGYEL